MRTIECEAARQQNVLYTQGAKRRKTTTKPKTKKMRKDNRKQKKD